MAVTSESFVKDLFAMVKERRSFGRHPLWRRIGEGKVARDGMKAFCSTVLPAGARISASGKRAAFALLRPGRTSQAGREPVRRGDRQDFRQRAASGVVHPFRDRTGDETGRVNRSDSAALDCFADRLVRTFDQDRSFAEGVGAINVAAEGQVVTNFGPFARALEKHYGLNRNQVAFFDVHELADRDHSDVGDHILSHMTLGHFEREKIRHAVNRSLDLWWQFFDGIERVCG